MYAYYISTAATGRYNSYTLTSHFGKISWLKCIKPALTLRLQKIYLILLIPGLKGSERKCFAY